PPRLAHLRRLLVASEPFSRALARRWFDAMGGSHQIVHMLGQTECGGAYSARLLTEAGVRGDGRVPLNLPFAAFESRLEARGCDEHELLLGGLDGADTIITGSGPSERCQATSGEAPPGWYPTGDVFRLGDESALLFSRRIDDHAKLFGQMIDL